MPLPSQTPVPQLLPLINPRTYSKDSLKANKTCALTRTFVRSFADFIIGLRSNLNLQLLIQLYTPSSLDVCQGGG